MPVSLAGCLAAAGLIQAAATFPPPGAPPPPPPPNIVGIPAKLEAATSARDAVAFASAFAPSAVITADGKLVASGSAQIRTWIGSQFSRGFSYHSASAAIGMHDIWSIDETFVAHPVKGDSCCLTARSVHYTHNNGVISTMDIVNIRWGSVYTPPPRY